MQQEGQGALGALLGDGGGVQRLNLHGDADLGQRGLHQQRDLLVLAVARFHAQLYGGVLHARRDQRGARLVQVGVIDPVGVGVARHAVGHDGAHGCGVALVDLFHDVVVGQGVGNRLAEVGVVKGGHAVVHDQHHRVGGGDGKHLDARFAFQGQHVAAAQAKGNVHVAALEHEHAVGFFRHNLHFDALVGDLAGPVGVLGQHNALPVHHFGHAVRPAGAGVLGLPVGGPGVVGRAVLGPGCRVIEEGADGVHVGLQGAEAVVAQFQRQVIHRGEVVNGGDADGAVDKADVGLEVQPALFGGAEGFGVDGVAVGEAHPLLEGDGPGQPILGDGIGVAVDADELGGVQGEITLARIHEGVVEEEGVHIFDQGEADQVALDKVIVPSGRGVGHGRNNHVGGGGCSRCSGRGLGGGRRWGSRCGTRGQEHR